MGELSIVEEKKKQKLMIQVALKKKDAHSTMIRTHKSATFFPDNPLNNPTQSSSLSPTDGEGN